MNLVVLSEPRCPESVWIASIDLSESDVRCRFCHAESLPCTSVEKLCLHSADPQCTSIVLVLFRLISVTRESTPPENVKEPGVFVVVEKFQRLT